MTEKTPEELRERMAEAMAQTSAAFVRVNKVRDDGCKFEVIYDDGRADRVLSSAHRVSDEADCEARRLSFELKLDAALSAADSAGWQLFRREAVQNLLDHYLECYGGNADQLVHDVRAMISAAPKGNAMNFLKSFICWYRGYHTWLNYSNSTERLYGLHQDEYPNSKVIIRKCHCCKYQEYYDFEASSWSR